MPRQVSSGHCHGRIGALLAALLVAIDFLLPSPDPVARAGPAAMSRHRPSLRVTTDLRDLADARGTGRWRIPDAREGRDRAGVTLAGPRADARALADRAGTRAVACEITDARAFRHGALAAEAGRRSVAAVLGDGALVFLAGTGAMAGVPADLAGVIEARYIIVAGSGGHVARVGGARV